MAAPAVGSRATGATSTADTQSHSITMPASISAGDLLLVVFSCDANPTVWVDQIASGTRWHYLANAANGSVVSGHIFAKIAEGSDALTLRTSSAEQSSHVSLRITGGNAVAAASANGSSTNSDPPNLSLGMGSPTTETLWIATRSGDSTVVASAAPASYGNLQSQAAAGTGGASTNTAERTLTADSENPGTFTSTTEQWASFTLGVFSRPQIARITQVHVETISIAGAAPPSSGQGPLLMVIGT